MTGEKKVVFIVTVEGGFLELIRFSRPCSTNSFWLGWTFYFARVTEEVGKCVALGILAEIYMFSKAWRSMHDCWDNLAITSMLQNFQQRTEDWLEHPSPEAYLSLHSSVLGFPRWLSSKESAAMQKTQVCFLGQEDPQEKKMATHSSILDWRIPWTEEPGRLQSMGLQKVRHNWATNTFMFKKKKDSLRKWTKFYLQINVLAL